MGDIGEIFQVDWRIFMAGAAAWIEGRSPYGPLSDGFTAGAFAYPPTALTWMAPFLLFGPLGFYLWTGLTLGSWWLIIRRRDPTQLLLLCWSPMILHLVQGQSSLPMVLIVWAAFLARRRGLLWGLALALTLTKPQVALLPLLALLWADRRSPLLPALLAGIGLGTLLLALPPTLRDPGIWGDWLRSLNTYRGRILQLAAWQGPSVLLVALAAYLWHRSGRGGWHWWLSAALVPHASFYSMVVLLPLLRLRPTPWLIGGVALAALLQGPVTPWSLPWILAGHLLAAWMIAGGPGALWRKP